MQQQWLYTQLFHSLFVFMNETRYLFSMVVKQLDGIRQASFCYYFSEDLLIFLNMKFLEKLKYKDQNDL